MKNKKENEKLRVLQYCDLSAGEEWRLRLIANLLLQVNGSLETDELNELGFQINHFLEMKIALDHLFWERPVSGNVMTKERLSSEIKIIKQKFNTKELYE